MREIQTDKPKIMGIQYAGRARRRWDPVLTRILVIAVLGLLAGAACVILAAR